MSVSYDRIDYLAITVPENNCTVGQVCGIDMQGNAVKCEAGGMICGVVEDVRNGRASVQVEGFTEQPYTGTEPSHGYVHLVGDGSGGVSVNTAGRLHLVLKVDTNNKTVVFKL